MPTDAKPTNTRHVVLWLTVAAYMITYMDRVVISFTLPMIKDELGISLAAAGLVTGAFRFGYSFFQIPSAWMGDKIGPRRALSLIVGWWSILTSLTAAMWNVTSLLVCRFLFGVGEAGAFPIATRSLSRWILPEERGYAQGITHAGSRLGAAIVPTLLAWMIAQYGWRMPFITFGILGLVWAAIWFFWYRDTPDEHQGTNAAERDLIHRALGKARSATTAKVPWRTILTSHSVWTLALMYACYGWALAIYLDWFPTYLKEARGLGLQKTGLYTSLPYLAAAVGNLAGGWVSDRMAIQFGNVRNARRWVAMTGFLIAALTIVPATLTRDVDLCVWLTCVALGSLEITVGVSWAVPLDIGGDYAGSVAAVMNSCGNLLGAVSSTVVGFIAATYGWERPFLIAAGFCVLGAILFSRIDASRQIEFAEEVVNA